MDVCLAALSAATLVPGEQLLCPQCLHKPFLKCTQRFCYICSFALVLALRIRGLPLLCSMLWSADSFCAGMAYVYARIFNYEGPGDAALLKTDVALTHAGLQVSMPCVCFLAALIFVFCRSLGSGSVPWVRTNTPILIWQ